MRKKNSGWETVASTLDEIKGLVASLKSTGSKREKELQTRLQEEIIAPIEDKILQNKLVCDYSPFYLCKGKRIWAGRVY